MLSCDGDGDGRVGLEMSASHGSLQVGNVHFDTVAPPLPPQASQVGVIKVMFMFTMEKHRSLDNLRARHIHTD